MRFILQQCFVGGVVFVGVVFGGLANAADKFNRPLEVSSDRVEYAAEGDAVFSGNVLVEAGGLSVRAMTLRVQMNDGNNHYVAVGAPISLACSDCADFVLSGEIGEMMMFDQATDRLQLQGGIFLCADVQCQRGELRADSVDWQRRTGILQLNGAPLVTARFLRPDETEPIHVSGRRLRYHVADGEIVLEEEAQIRRGDSNIEGERIQFNINTGALQAGTDKGRVKATIQ